MSLLQKIPLKVACDWYQGEGGESSCSSREGGGSTCSSQVGLGLDSFGLGVPAAARLALVWIALALMVLIMFAKLPGRCVCADSAVRACVREPHINTHSTHTCATDE